MPPDEESDEEELTLDWLWISPFEDNPTPPQTSGGNSKKAYSERKTRVSLPEAEGLELHNARGNEEVKMELRETSTVAETPEKSKLTWMNRHK